LCATDFGALRNTGGGMNSRSELEKLYESLQRCKSHPSKLEYKTRVFAGLETRTDPKEYYWHGRKRRKLETDPFEHATNPCGPATNPYVVWQYTLSGWGAFHSAGSIHPSQVVEATAFTTVVPSDDLYYLPAESRGWRFFWFIIDHPYVVHRIRLRQRTAGQIWEIPPKSALVSQAVDLYHAVISASFEDEYAEESTLFQFLIEYERFGHNLVHPATPRERLLADIRSEILACIRRGLPTIEEIAKQRGMSRTRFAHYFKETTGLTPASFITRVRVGEVTRLLVSSDLKLSAIADLTGFADATHLCRVFRRHFYLTPDSYRHVMRSTDSPGGSLSLEKPERGRSAGIIGPHRTAL
jgi:AraC-like DNA-binding protein